MSNAPVEPPEPPESHSPGRLSRRAFTGGAAAVTSTGLLGRWASAASATEGGPHRFGSVTTAPRLPTGFTRTFKSRMVHANGIRQHVVIGGAGPPVLLVHGWQEPHAVEGRNHRELPPRAASAGGQA
jgi:hypothetical protein